MHSKLIVALLIVPLAAVMAAAPAFAGDPGQYAADAGTKLGRGVVNTVTGWGEIPMQTIIGSQEAGALGGIGGFFKGIGLGVIRTLSGAFEIATFWAPVPEGFEPVMEPATVFDWPTDKLFATTGSQTANQ